MATGDFWVADDVVAYIENGSVTISIQRSLRMLPKEKAYKVADPIWYEAQLRKVELARKRGETAVIPLTDRLRRSSVRLGGGFLIVQGKRIILFRRTIDAPRRASEFCECGGVFEVGTTTDPFDTTNDLIASLLKESPELALVREERLYVPQLAMGETSIGFQPSDIHVSEYDEIMREELEREVKESKLPISKGPIRPTRFFITMLNYERSAKLQFAYSPPVSVDFTAEIDSSSLEFVGVLNYPDDLDLAALAFLEDKIFKLERLAKGGNATAEDLDALEREKEEKRILEEELKAKANRPPLEYWDTERAGDTPLNREIHIVDIQTGNVEVWFTPVVAAHGKTIAPSSTRRTRKMRQSTLWKELSRTHLGSTGGRFATEKVEKAIKMHCPLPWLQPLITL
jgi:hypothetical protein